VAKVIGVIFGPFEIALAGSHTHHPLALVEVAIRPEVGADPVRLIVAIVSEIIASIRVDILTKTVFFILLPETSVYSPICPLVNAKSVLF
jgi:hypothetical protein